MEYLVIEQYIEQCTEKGIVIEERRRSPNYKTLLGAKRAMAKRYSFGGTLLIATTEQGW